MQIADHLRNWRDVIGRLALTRLWNRGNILAGKPRDCVPLGWRRVSRVSRVTVTGASSLPTIQASRHPDPSDPSDRSDLSLALANQRLATPGRNICVFPHSIRYATGSFGFLDTIMRTVNFSEIPNILHGYEGAGLNTIIRLHRLHQLFESIGKRFPFHIQNKSSSMG